MASFLQWLLSEAFGPSHVWVSIPERKGLQEGRSGVSCPGLGRPPGVAPAVPGDRGHRVKGAHAANTGEERELDQLKGAHAANTGEELEGRASPQPAWRRKRLV